MDPDLKNKAALFSNLQSLGDAESDDELFEMEETQHRVKCKAFAELAARQPVSKSRSTFCGTTKQPAVTPRRTGSEPTVATPNTAVVTQSEVIVIEDTPQPTKRLPAGQPRVSSLLHVTADSNIEETSIPDSTRARRASSQPGRRVSNPLVQRAVRSSPPPTEDSPSVTMGKRKRAVKLKMAPEAHQCFKGLSFFYIPNNDHNAAREIRITRAREYGAEWVRSIEESTHVVVDADLKYSDIEKIIAADATHKVKIVVNDTYPLQCISYKRLLDPSQQSYRVPGYAQPSSRTADASQPSQESVKSLQLKPPKSHTRKGYVATDATPPRSDASTQRSTQGSSGHVISESQLGSQIAVVVPIKHTTTNAEEDVPQEAVAGTLDESEATCPGANDELAEYINYLKAHPEVEDGLENNDEDIEGPLSSAPAVNPDISHSQDESSDGEHHSKKRKEMPGKKSSENGNWQDNFACMKGGTKNGDSGNPNTETIIMLQKLLDEYTLNSDHWRMTSYRRAISILGQHPTKISTSKEAKALVGIGDSIADKIEEIVNTGRLRKYEEAQRDPLREVRQLFLKVYGVGPQRADAFISQGHRTLEDLVARANLSRNQRIGIDHFEDLNTRIPRREVEALGNHAKRAAHEIDPRVEMLIGGSYRRGSDSSGDVDLIITKKGTTMSHDLGPFLDMLVRRLTEEGFLTAGLATSRNFNGNKWHGCCVLPADEFPGDKTLYKPVWRRIDFLLVPETEFGGALIYFTGNDLFNRSMRLLANKKGMSLSHRGLSKYILRGPDREKLTEGVLIEGRSEKKIFEILGVKWREPSQRWC